MQRFSPTSTLRSVLAGRRPGGWASSAPSVAALLAATVLAACGGGGEGTVSTAPSSTLPSVTTTGYTQGTVTGFGSVIVNGVRFDDSAATVTDDGGLKSTASALRLGMRVEVDHGTVDASSGTATAAAFRYGSLVLGPVSAVSTSNSTLTVLGQVVDVTSSTVFDDTLAAGLSAVATGTVVEVHGVLNSATGHLTATRIEAEPGATAYKLRGTVAALDTAAKTFSINGTAISYASLASSLVPSTLANGSTLRVLLATAQSGGFWVATSLGLKPTSTPPPDHTSATVRGAISAFTSATRFSVDGLAVDATNASFPDGSTGLALGVQVEVKGTVSNGVLVATRVSLESSHRGDDSHALHLYGAITAVNATAKTLVVRNVTVSYADTTTYVNGGVTDLAVGRKVHVQGAVGSTRSQVLASSVTFE